MSEIYVKWNDLSRHAEQLNSCAKWVREYMNRVDNVKNQLRLSDSVSSQIKTRLAADSERLGNISGSMVSLSETLNTIANMYKDTEHQMLDD